MVNVEKFMSLTPEQVWQILEDVKDPEIPVVSVVEMGIIRHVAVEGESVQVMMTPTFSGCPALELMRREIADRLSQAGVKDVEVKLSNQQAWSSDWITPEGRQKLKQFGLAPPPRHGGNFEIAFQEPVACPYCGSTNTSMKNPFGSTLCRAIYYCNHCQQPFERFKPI